MKSFKGLLFDSISVETVIVDESQNAVAQRQLLKPSIDILCHNHIFFVFYQVLNLVQQQLQGLAVISVLSKLPNILHKALVLWWRQVYCVFGLFLHLRSLGLFPTVALKDELVERSQIELVHLHPDNIWLKNVNSFCINWSFLRFGGGRWTLEVEELVVSLGEEQFVFESQSLENRQGKFLNLELGFRHYFMILLSSINMRQRIKLRFYWLML